MRIRELGLAMRANAVEIKEEEGIHGPIYIEFLLLSVTCTRRSPLSRVTIARTYPQFRQSVTIPARGWRGDSVCGAVK